LRILKKYSIHLWNATRKKKRMHPSMTSSRENQDIKDFVLVIL
jgi:hypothetical protein